MRAKKAYGQHFLHDGSVLRAIVDALDAQPDERIVEIGPGTGRLTRKLVEAVGADRLVCVERDRDMITHLATYVPEVEVVRGDATQISWEALTGPAPALAVGNLPYNAATPIYFSLLESRHLFRRLVLMFQKEVADRLLAQPGTKRYGPPSVLTTLLSDARRVRNVPPSSFRPRPRVDSAVISVDPLEHARFGVQPAEIAPLQQFVRALFQQRRKTIANNLRAEVGPRAVADLEATGIAPSARPETVPPEALVQLWRRVVSHQYDSPNA